MINFGSQPGGFSRFHFTIMPVCDKVKGMNTPTAYSGIKCSVLPSKAMISRMDNTPKMMIPFEYPSRSPRTVNMRGMNLSLARLTASSGNAE
ncbi:hypothetical protein D3C73_1437670 [compost metagenome]